MVCLTRLDDSRVANDDVETIKCISSVFGDEGWKKAIIVFTYADKVEEHEYQNFLDTKTKQIKEKIQDITNQNITDKIPSVAVTNKRTKNKLSPTPDGKVWLDKLYMSVIRRISKDGLLPVVILTEDRVISNKINNSSRETALIKLSDPDIRELKTKVEESCKNNNSQQSDSEEYRTYKNTRHYKNKRNSYRRYRKLFCIVLCTFIELIGCLFFPPIGMIIGGVIVIGFCLSLIIAIFKIIGK